MPAGWNCGVLQVLQANRARAVGPDGWTRLELWRGATTMAMALVGQSVFRLAGRSTSSIYRPQGVLSAVFSRSLRARAGRRAKIPPSGPRGRRTGTVFGVLGGDNARALGDLEKSPRWFFDRIARGRNPRKMGSTSGSFARDYARVSGDLRKSSKKGPASVTVTVTSCRSTRRGRTPIVTAVPPGHDGDGAGVAAPAADGRPL